LYQANQISAFLPVRESYFRMSKSVLQI